MRYVPHFGQLVVSTLSVLLGSVLAVPPLSAQTDPQPAVAWPAQLDDGTDPDPAVVPTGIDYPSTLGDDMLASDADPSLVNPARDLGTDTLIYPLGLTVVDPSAQQSTNSHYLSYTYKGTPVVLVGVSADNACHFISPGYAQCYYGTGTGVPYGGGFKPFLDDLAAQGLNSIRLWVSLLGEGTTAKVTPTPAPAPRRPP